MAFRKQKSKTRTQKSVDYSTLKNSVIRFRVTKSEKREIKEMAKLSGFDTVSAYLLSLHRKTVEASAQ